MNDVLGYPFRHILSLFGSRRGFFSRKDELDAFFWVSIKRRLGERALLGVTELGDMGILDAILDLGVDDITKATSVVVEFPKAVSLRLMRRWPSAFIISIAILMYNARVMSRLKTSLAPAM